MCDSEPPSLSSDFAYGAATTDNTWVEACARSILPLAIKSEPILPLHACGTLNNRFSTSAVYALAAGGLASDQRGATGRQATDRAVPAIGKSSPAFAVRVCGLACLRVFLLLLSSLAVRPLLCICPTSAALDLRGADWSQINLQTSNVALQVGEHVVWAGLNDFWYSLDNTGRLCDAEKVAANTAVNVSMLASAGAARVLVGLQLDMALYPAFVEAYPELVAQLKDTTGRQGLCRLSCCAALALYACARRSAVICKPTLLPRCAVPSSLPRSVHT